MQYSLYGRRLRSSRVIPGLPTTSIREADLEIAFGQVPPSARESAGVVYDEESLTVSRTRTGYHFTYSDKTEFLISESADRVTASTPPGATLEDTCTYLVGPVLGFALRLRGVVCLHASTVVIGGRAIAFCGAPGAGKSSTAAAFAQMGYPVLAEDVAALDDRGDTFAVQPGYPRVNLWPHSAAALCGSADALPAITPNWEKRYLPLHRSFHSDPAPLAAIYILRDRLAQSRPEIRPLKPMDALIALASNTYTPYLLDAAMRVREFDVLTRLTRSVPVRAISPPADIADIGALCDGILSDFAALSEPRPTGSGC